MCEQIPLETYLAGWGTVSAERRAVAKIVLAIAAAAHEIGDLVAQGPLAGALGSVVGGNSDGDAQKQLDIRANELLIAALKGADVALIASEELETPIECDPKASLIVALDPLDGSSNIDANVSIGTIFSVLPVPGPRATNGSPNSAFLQSGSQQKAAGYVIYGPQCAIALTVGKGTHVFTLDRRCGVFRMTQPGVRIPEATREFAINASNQRHWSPGVQAYIADCLAGKNGPRAHDCNMRWIASLVAECHRILSRGGIFLYPRDARKGYEQGRLRLVYEANPIAWLVEQAGGNATDGMQRILDLRPTKLHERTPLVFGSAEEVERVARYKTERRVSGERSQLFSERGLFRI